MIRIAIEATGCDKGFSEVLRGAKIALERDRGLELILVGGEDKLPESYFLGGVCLEKTECTYNSENSKEKQFKSSIYRAMEIHKDGKVEAVIAPGDTRGSVISAGRILGLMKNVLAPAIPTFWPRNNVLIDSGANPESTPENLMQSAIMGHVYSKYFVGVEKPLIGILSNGVERNKGNKFVRESRRLIEKRLVGYNLSELYFEGDCVEELDGGQVRVTDGHTGNEILKIAEGCLTTSFSYLFEKIKNQNIVYKALAKLILSKPIKEMRRELNYESYAVGPLLGVDGNVMIAHGRSDAETIANAINITKKYLERDINKILREEIAKYGVVELAEN